jgi:hypothetical protein
MPISARLWLSDCQCCPDSPGWQKYGFDNKNSDSSAWRWRFFMAEQLAARLDPQKYGVKKLYLIGHQQRQRWARQRCRSARSFSGNDSRRRTCASVPRLE